MDYQRKKMMTQSVAFLQAHLKLCENFLEALARDNVLTREEVSTVQKDATPSGKVLELVCIIKRKDTRTFNKFLEILDANDQTTVSQVLQRTGNPSDTMAADPRTLNVLENHLPDAPSNVLHDLSAYLVPSEVYHDDIKQLQTEIASLQKTLAAQMYMKPHREKTQLSADNLSALLGGGTTRRSGSGNSTPATSSQPGWSGIGGSNPGEWDLPPVQQEELINLLKQKDAILARKDEEYSKLRKILADTQQDMQGVLDLNSQYLAIISQLNQMQAASGPGGSREQTETMQELEEQMEEARVRIEQLQVEVDEVAAQLHQSQSEHDKALRREKKYKDMLGLPVDADEKTVTDRIQDLLSGGKMSMDELEKIRKELSKAHAHRVDLNEKVSMLEREKEKVEFHMRQQDLTVKRMHRQKTATVQVAKAQHMLRNRANDPRLSSQLRLPSIDLPRTGIALTATGRVGIVHPQYCMFCRMEFTPLKSPAQQCRVHHRPSRHGNYTCCNDPCHRSAGCVQIPHFYLELTVDKRCFLTDGARYMEISPN